MAYTRTNDTSKNDANVKVLGSGLDAFISNSVTAFEAQVKASDAAEEAKFQQLVQKGDMTLADQISYRKAQLSNTQDVDMRASIRAAIANLQDQKDQKDFSDAYTKQLQDHASGIESSDTLISWLQSQLASATDVSVKDKINAELVTQQSNRFTQVQQMLKDQTDYAMRDKTDAVINTQVSALQTARNNASLAGDKATVANIDLQIQSLKQTLSEQNIVNQMRNFGVASVSGSSSAVDLLNSYGSQISNADSSTPVTVNGQTYASAQQYWTYTRDSYVADQGASGFFSRLDNEQKTALDVKSSNNTLTQSDVASTASLFTNLQSRADLAPFSAQLIAAKQDAMQHGADQISNKVQKQFDVDNDLNVAISTLTSLKALGVNVDDATQKIMTSAATIKTNQVQNIMTAAQSLMGADPNLSITDAVNQAITKGAGVVLSPKDLLNNSAASTVSSNLTSTKNSSNTEGTNLTIGAPKPTTTTPTPGAGIQGAGKTATADIPAGYSFNAAGKLTNNAGQEYVPPAQQNGVTVQAPTAPVVPKAPTVPTTTQTSTHPATAPVNPTPTPASPTVASGTYTIKSGDTLSAIAAQHGTTVANLAKLNNIADPNKINSGATIKLQ